jgi:hypothetical protein
MRDSFKKVISFLDAAILLVRLLAGRLRQPITIRMNRLARSMWEVIACIRRNRK